MSKISLTDTTNIDFTENQGERQVENQGERQTSQTEESPKSIRERIIDWLCPIFLIVAIILGFTVLVWFSKVKNERFRYPEQTFPPSFYIILGSCIVSAILSGLLYMSSGSKKDKLQTKQ